MVILNGKVEQRIRQGVTIYVTHLSVDEICQDDTPNVNFIGFCIQNNLLEYDEETKTYHPNKMLIVDLDYSKDKEKNKRVEDMFRKYDIDCL